MAYTTPSTWVAGAVLTAAQLNTQLRDNVRFLHGPPTARVQGITDSTFANGAYTATIFSQEDWDSDNMWSSTANTKLICRTAGKYQVHAGVSFFGSTGGTIRGVGIRKNSTTGSPTDGIHFHRHDMIAGTQEVTISNLVSLTTGQFIQIVGFQDSGGNLGSSGTGGMPFCSMLWVSS